MSGATLGYESSVNGALQDGERIVWEERPDASRIRDSWALRGLLVAIITCVVGVAAASASRDIALTFIAVVASVVFVGGAMLLAGSGDTKKRREIESIVYRITNQRVIRIREEPVRLVTEADVDVLRSIRVLISRSGDGSVEVNGYLSMSHLPKPHDLSAHAIDVVRCSGRRARLRRSPASITHEDRMPDEVVPALTPVPPPGVALADGEVVVWVGRPRMAPRHDRAWLTGRLQLLGFTALAAYWLLASLDILPSPFGRVPWWAGLIAALFLLGFLKSLLITPFQERSRHRRTTYALTNIRAIVHLADRTAVTESYLLDMCGGASMGEGPDGSGYVQFGMSGPLFARIDEVATVHQMALEAIRRAGTPITPPENDDDLM